MVKVENVLKGMLEIVKNICIRKLQIKKDMMPRSTTPEINWNRPTMLNYITNAGFKKFKRYPILYQRIIYIRMPGN